jgi:hypothetical protein
MSNVKLLKKNSLIVLHMEIKNHLCYKISNAKFVWNLYKVENVIMQYSL